jgi:outer membrane protein TolC
MLLSGFRFRRAIRRAPWFVFLAFACSGLAGQPAEYAGTLPEDYLPGLKPILEAAVKQAPQVLLREIQISRAEARVYDADHERWPNIGGNIRYDSNQTGVSGNSNTQSRDSGLFYSVSADQAVFHWGEIRNNGRIARIEVAIAQKDFAEAYRMLAVQIRQSYLGLVWRNARLQAMRYDLKLRNDDLSAAKQNVVNGTLSAAELGDRQLRLAQAELDLERMQLEFDGERRRLARLAGVADVPADQIPSEVPRPRYDPKTASELLAGLLRDGGKSAFEAQVAQLHIKEADLNYRIARVRLLPKFNAGLSHSRESSTTATPNEVLQTAITRDTFELRGNWTIFDGFATKAAKLSAQADKRQWERQLQMATESVMDEAQQLERTVDIDARAMNLADQRLGLAEAAVRLTEEQVKQGRASQQNVDEAVNNQRNAEWNAALYRTTFLSDWAAFISRVSDDPALNNLPSRYVRATR